MALGRAVQGKPEQQYGETIIPAERPDWRVVERLADALMARSKDIRVCVFLARALTQNHGIPGLAVALELIVALQNNYWDEIHPRLVLDGEVDPYARINAIADLSDAAGLLRDLRSAVLIKSPVGSILVKEAEAALESGHSDSGVSRHQLVAASAEARDNPQSPLLAVNLSLEAVTRINLLCKERFSNEQSPDLSGLTMLLTRLSLLSAASAAESNDVGVGTEEELDAPNSIGPGKSNGAFTKINSRQDVVRMLDLVCRYIEETEPTNPAPLLIKRAQRLMTLDFMGIMREMSPDSISQIELITGVRHE